MSETKLLSPKLDVVFQRLFGELGSEKITKRFIEKILGEKIEKVDLSKNPILRRETLHGKLGVLDVLVEFNESEKINLEMQVAKREDILERLLYYWSRLYTRGIQEGEEYVELERTIVVLITEFELKGLEELGYHTEWKIIEEKERKKILTDKLEIHILELNKIKGKENEDDELLDWLFFIDNPKSERVREAMKENEELQEANKKLNRMSEEEEMQRIAWWREKALHDEASLKGMGKREGIAIGEERGIKIGREEGKQKEKEEIAKKMLQEKMEIHLIAKLTGLSEEEIQKLKES